MWGPLRHLQQDGSSLKAAELGTGLTASVDGCEQPAWDRVKYWPGTDRRPGSGQKHQVWVATHPRATQGKRTWVRAFHICVTRGKGDKEFRVLARDG